MARLSFISLFAFLSLTGCERKQAEVIGFGDYELGKTTPKDAGRCTPLRTVNHCFLNKSSTLAGHKTVTDLYFKGLEDTSPLVEVFVTIKQCKRDVIAQNLEKRMGEPVSKDNGVWVWKQTSANVALQMKSGEQDCQMYVLDKTETERLEKIQAG